MSKDLSWLIEQLNKAKDIQTFAADNLLKLVSSGDGRHILNYAEIILGTPRNWISHFCRGLCVAGEPQHYFVAASAFPRFFNLGEAPEYLEGGDQIDFDKPFDLYFKYDGSIMLEYAWQGQIAVNTRGSFAEGKLPNFSQYTWRKLFEEAKSIGQSDPLGHPELTYIWELCTPYNQVVEYYKEPFKVLLAAFDKEGNEVLVDGHSLYAGQIYQASSREEVFKLLSELKSTQEGFVIAQNQNGRLVRRKCKTQTWVELSHAKEAGFNSLEGLVNVVYQGDTDEVSAVFPHLKPKLEQIKATREKMLSELNEVWEEIKDIDNQKEFALKALKYPFHSLLFAKRSKWDTLELEKKTLRKYL